MNPIDERVARLAALEGGVVTRLQLLEAGLTDHAIEQQLRRKRWAQLQRGVYLLSAAKPTWRQLVRAAALAAGEPAQASARTLAAWLGLDGATEGTIEVTVPYGKGPEPRGVKVHRTRHIGPMRMHDGLPGTTVERLLVDYAAFVAAPIAERAVESALTRGLTAEPRIWREIAALGSKVPGVSRLDRIMALRPKGKAARSGLELSVLRLIRNAGLPLPERNHDAYVDGKHFEIDLAYVEVRGAIEADGRKHHSTATQRANDRRRQATLEIAGWNFVRVTSADVYGRPEWVIDQVRSLLCGVVAV